MLKGYVNHKRVGTGKVLVRIRCKHCSVLCEVAMSWIQLAQIKLGEKLIQDILPKHSSAQRELIISACCPICWENLFGPGTDKPEGLLKAYIKE